jgi:hypothetical protein
MIIIRFIEQNIYLIRMSMITEDFIEMFQVMLYMCFDILSDGKVNGIFGIFGDYMRIYCS